MVKTLHTTVILLAISLIFAACARQVPVENVENVPVPTGSHTLTSKEISSVIAHAAIDRGWTVTQSQPGKIHLHIMRHETSAANAEVIYNTHSYSIRLVSSDNFDQEDGRISSVYNRYVDHLKRDIDKGLDIAAFK